MEVMISIGVLAIGLTSVMSLIPAGKSEAGKALIYDRAATMAMNGLADAVTFGLTRPDSIGPTLPATATVVFDTVPFNSISDATVTAVASAATLKSAGVLAALSGTSTVTAPITKLFTQGRDDVVYNPAATADDPATNRFINGIRGFEGRMTSMIALTEADTGTPPLAAGDLATLSVIVFHNRDTNTPPVPASINTAGLVTLSALPADRTLKSIMRPNVVFYYVDNSVVSAQRLRFGQLSMAAVDTTTGDTYVTVKGRQMPASTTTIYVLLDSVGLAEQTVSLEGPSPYGQ